MSKLHALCRIGLVAAAAAAAVGCIVGRANGPRADLLGVSVGMQKVDVISRLGQIGEFERDERRNQQLWRLTNDPRYAEVAVGFDKEDRLRYITAFARTDADAEKVPFASIGDVGLAKSEVVGRHHRYTWQVPGRDGQKPFAVSIYGDNPENLTMFSLVEGSADRSGRSGGGGEEEEDE